MASLRTAQGQLCYNLGGLVRYQWGGLPYLPSLSHLRKGKVKTKGKEHE